MMACKPLRCQPRATPVVTDTGNSTLQGLQIPYLVTMSTQSHVLPGLNLDARYQGRGPWLTSFALAGQGMVCGMNNHY